MPSRVLFLAVLAAAGLSVRPGSAQAGPKVLIYVDMDGSSGAARPQQVLYPNTEYFASRKFITADVNAAIRGLKAGGAGEIVVTDAHGSGNAGSPDVLVDKMDKRATFLFRDTPYDPYLEAMDPTYQAIVCVGMHARAGSRGFMAHTVTLEPIYTVNGARITESALIALSAARFKIPVIMIAGDDVLEGEIKEELPLAEYAVVKRAKTRALADTIPQPLVQVAIERAAKAAIEKLGSFTPYPVAPSYRFEISYQNVRQADLAGTIPGTTRIDSLTLGYTSPDFPEGYRLSLRMLDMVRLDRLRWMFRVVDGRPDAKALRRKYMDLLVTNWLEPDKMPKVPARPAKPGAKRRYWGDT
ncbi:MAG: M55 family metallopeptidase [Gemmatimonadota bacterium]